MYTGAFEDIDSERETCERTMISTTTSDLFNYK